MPQYDLTLTVLQGRNSGDRLTFNLQAGNGLHLGRGRQNDVVIPDPQVSKLHAFIELTDSGPKLFDLKSNSGTMLMGFPVTATGEPLKPQDEFKLANTVLSVDWIKKEDPKPSTPGKKLLDLGNKKTKIGVASLLGLLLLALLLPSSGSSGASSILQKKDPVEFSDTKTYGFIKGGDRSHPYEIKAELPPGDLNIEFQAKTAIPIAVYRNDTLLGRIAVTDSWERYSLLLRDQAEGDTAVLKFVGNAPKANVKEWAISRLRYFQFPDDQEDSTENIPTDNGAKLQLIKDSLQDTLQSCLIMFSTTDGMWNAREALQQALMLIINLNNESGILVPISDESPNPSITRYETEIGDLILAAKNSSPTDAALNQLLGAKESKLVELLSELESELWRRALNRVTSAVLAAKAQNYRQALLDRLNLEQSFPQQNDLRFKDTREKIDKAIPKRVLSNPEKYLRESR
jgi:hypothetical protein